jgi:hypothetical protein
LSREKGRNRNMIHPNALRRTVPKSILSNREILSEITIFILRPTVPIHCKVKMTKRNVQITAISLHHLGGRTLRLTQLLLKPGNPSGFESTARVLSESLLVFVQEQCNGQHVTTRSLVPKTFTCGALDTREESATAEIRTDGPIMQRGTPLIASRITATASRHVPIKATTAATSRAIAVIGTMETVLFMFDTIDLRTVTLDPTQRELVIGDRGQRRRIPFTSHPP